MVSACSTIVDCIGRGTLVLVEIIVLVSLKVLRPGLGARYRCILVVESKLLVIKVVSGYEIEQAVTSHP